MSRAESWLKMAAMVFFVFLGIFAILTITASASLQCSFETNEICNWQNDPTNGNYTWKRSTQTAETGKYLYAAGTGKNSIARFLSGLHIGTICLKFRYRMAGLSIGKLRIIVQGNEKWMKSGDQGSSWNNAQVSIEVAGPYEITIEAEEGLAGGVHNIAIDEITTQNEKCKSILYNECGVHMKGLGCYTDSTTDRALPELLTSHREIGKSNTLINWSHYESSVKTLLCSCAHLARAKGYKYFGLQFYGECWSGPGELKYGKHGPATGCINGKFQQNQCLRPFDDACVGQVRMNYVYEIM